MKVYFGERAHSDHASAILDLNSEEAWERRKGALGTGSEVAWNITIKPPRPTLPLSCGTGKRRPPFSHSAGLG